LLLFIIAGFRWQFVPVNLGLTTSPLLGLSVMFDFVYVTYDGKYYQNNKPDEIFHGPFLNEASGKPP